MNGKAEKYLFIAPIILFLLAVSSIIYANSLDNGFVYDDRHLVVNNLFIRNAGNIPVLFNTGLHHFENVLEGEGSFYRPVVGLSYMVDYMFFRLKPFGYHLTNMLLHTFVSFLVFALIYIVFREFMLSMGTAILFLVHPVQTEAVSYISGRADPMAGAFMLLYLIFFALDLKSRERKGFISKNFIFANIALFLAFLSKEISLIALPLLALVFYVHNRWEDAGARRKLSFVYPYTAFFVLLLFIYLFLRRGALGGLPGMTSNVPLATRLLTTVSVIPVYFKIIFFPVGLHMERTAGLVSSPANTRFIFSAVFVLAAAAIAVISGKRSRHVAFSSLWFFIAFFPYLNIVPLNAEIAEHWLYVPMVGASLLVTFIFIAVYRRLKKNPLRFAVPLCYVTIVIALGILTIRQNAYWKDELGFFRRTLEYSPKNVRVLSNLAALYLERGEYEKASAIYEKAIREKPREYRLYNNLAAIYIETGQHKRAEKMLLRSIEINPRTAFPYNNLGVLYLRQGRAKDAERYFRNAVAKDNDFFEAHYNLGVVLDAKGDLAGAERSFKKVEKINPGYKNTRSFLDKYEARR